MDLSFETEEEINRKTDKNNNFSSKISNRYKSYTLSNIDRIKELETLDENTIRDMKIVAHVLPFKTNNYVLQNLINWNDIPNDPIFQLTLPQKDMLLPHHFKRMKEAIVTGDKNIIKKVSQSIRLELNPYPAGQKTCNIPKYNGKKLNGVQHKYQETVLLFPSNGQSCHAYCTFCFRWSQFVTIDANRKFGMKPMDDFVNYIHEHPTITDILITGGDPMIMHASVLEKYLRPIIEANIPHLRTIRIGSKSLSYWPHRFINDKDTSTLLSLFQEIKENGLNVAFMAHFNHFRELQSPYLELAVKNLQEVGVMIRTQSPLLNHINALADVWAEMWRKQVALGMIPYYMFVVRDTGAQYYFSVPLVKAWLIFKKAYSKVSGICRTVRGPSMSCTPGKISVQGIAKINEQKVIVLSFIQGRNPDWVKKPFFAKYNPNATWIDALEPAFSEEFFYEKDLPKYLGPYNEIKHCND
ncbi:MAG TPA: lysine 2,3-aminomutase [candidate division Zixibacteria bacterium]|nr:lysine 2,3-aminomutase [candidate division Zixibacteria bacterium]